MLAPLPNITLAGGYRIAEKVYLKGNAGWLSLTYGDYEGDLWSFRGSVEWRPWNRVGLGLGYQYIDVDAVVDRSDHQELYDIKLDGPVLFISVGF